MNNTISSSPDRGGICVSIAATDTTSALSLLHPVRQSVDIAEIRLDAMHEYDISALCQQIELPLLFTNRPDWEGGSCMAPEEERIVPLLNSVNHGASFVDLELKTAPVYREQLLEKINNKQARMIISYHDFENTPDSASLSLILQQQIESGAHIGKIVTMAHNHLDVLRVLNLQCEAKSCNFPLIAFCMGEAGRISRVITLLLGGFMTYAAIDITQETAPGQLSVQQLKKMLTALSENNITL